VAWVVKGSKNLLLLILHVIYRWKMFVALLQHAQTTYISKWAIIVNEGSFRVGVFLNVHPLSFFDMLLVRGVIRYMPFSLPLFCPY